MLKKWENAKIQKKKGKKVSEETKHISQQVKYEGVNEKEFYLLLYSLALRTISLQSPQYAGY